MTITSKTSALELAMFAKSQREDSRYAYNAKDSMVAGWAKTLGRWQVVASRALPDNRWVSVEYELLTNGRPWSEGQTWIEV